MTTPTSANHGTLRRVVKVRGLLSTSPSTVYVGRGYETRPSVFGNPYKVDEHGRRRAIELYRALLEEETSKPTSALKRAVDGLLVRLRAGEDLALECWCSLAEDCHADVLIEHLSAELARDSQGAE